MAENKGLQQTAIAEGTTVPVLDIDNKQVLHVSRQQAAELLPSGKYALPKGYQLPVINPEGQAGTIDAAHALDALKAGYQIETEEAQHQREVQAQYGDSEGLAALAGAARGLTFGLSDQALTKTGLVAPETLAGLEEANPISSVAGEVGGIVAPALLSGGTSLVGTAAKGSMAGVEAAAQVGKTAERIVAKSPAGEGLKQSVVKSLAAKAAGSAVEGAFYGAGQLVSEEALGKADFNAESLASHIGTGALLGGAFGGVFAGAGALVDTVAPVVKTIASPFTSKISNALDAEVATARTFGISPTQLAKLKERNPRVIEDMQRYLKEDLQLSVTDTAEDIARKLEANKAKAGDDIAKAYKDLDSATEFFQDLKPTNQEVFGNMYQKISDKYLPQIEGAGALGGAEQAKLVRKFLATVENLGTKEGALSAQTLQDFKVATDKLLKYEKTPGKWTLKEDLLFDARQVFSEEIGALATRLEERGLNPAIAGNLKQANQRYANAATLGDFIESRALKAADRDFSFSGALKDTALDVSRKLVVLGRMESANQAMRKTLALAADAIVSPAKKLAAKSTPLTTDTLLKTALAKDYTGEKPRAPKTRTEAYQNIAKNLNSYTVDPSGFADRVNKQTSVVYNAAPNTAGELDRVAFAAAQFLQSKLPKNSLDGGVLQSYLPPRQPSTMEMAKFERYLDAVNSPAKVLQDITKGSVTREQTEALRAVYPTVYQALRDTVMEQLPEKAPKMTYQQKLTLGVLLNLPTDPSLRPEAVMALQQQIQGDDSQQPGDGAVNVTQGGVSKIESGERSRTGLDSLAETGAGGE